MGIPTLNYFLRKKCSEGIRNIRLSYLTGKKIAIDASIYLYKYKGKGNIIENMYIMCSIFKKYGIIPIFIFDGKPPPEKSGTIKRRRDKKNKAEADFNKLKEELNLCNSAAQRIQKVRQMKTLEKKFIRINSKDISKVKTFLKCYGIRYFTADGEADKCCAQLVHNNEAYACLSEDMDLFAYGCPYVLRQLNLFEGRVFLYDLPKIINLLNINIQTFRQLCVLTGTDYSSFRYYKSFNYYYQLFKRYEKTKSPSFYLWLNDNNLLPQTISKLQHTYSLFDISTSENQLLSYTKTSQPQMNCKELRKILEAENFIFPPPAT